MRRRPSDLDIAKFRRRLKFVFDNDNTSEKSDSADGSSSRLFNDLDMHGPKSAEIGERVFDAYRLGGVRDPNTFPTWLKNYWLLAFENFFGQENEPTLPAWIKSAYETALALEINFDDLNKEQKEKIISTIFSAYIENCVEAFTRLTHEEEADVFERIWTVGTFLAKTNPPIHQSAEIDSVLQVFQWYKESFNGFEDQYEAWIKSDPYAELVNYLHPFADPRRIIGKIKTEILRLGDTSAAKAIEMALKNILLEQPDSIVHSRAQQLLDSRDLLQKILPALYAADVTAYNNMVAYANSSLTIKNGVTIKLIQNADQFSSGAINFYSDRDIRKDQLIAQLKKQDVQLRAYQLVRELQTTNDRYLQKHAAGFNDFQSYQQSCGWGWRWPLYKRCRQSVEIAFQLKTIYENAVKPEASSTERAKALSETQNLKRKLQGNDSIFSTLIRLITGFSGGSELYRALDRVMPVVPTSIQDMVRKPLFHSLGEEKPISLPKPQVPVSSDGVLEVKIAEQKSTSPIAAQVAHFRAELKTELKEDSEYINKPSTPPVTVTQADDEAQSEEKVLHQGLSND